MGLRENFRAGAGKLGARIGVGLIFLLVGLTSPWWVTLLIAALLVIANLLLIEIVIIGIILDVLLLSSAKPNILNLFYTLCLLMIALIITWLKITLNRSSV